MKVFRVFGLRTGVLVSFGDDFSTFVSAWTDEPLVLRTRATHFGIVHGGPSRLTCQSGTFHLAAGMYFSVPGEMRIESGTGIVVTKPLYRGFFYLGGPVEETGRLRYIDGCTDSLLIPPIVRGDPCLNLLHLPPGIRQSTHTHPSFRIGLVMRGSGHCLTPEGRTALTPGQVFAIQAHGLHCFHTDENALLVAAYHPDSDFGPTHEDHPMINRTFLSENQDHP
jgi:hypothetical protein